jgi:hypothetical protein
MQAHEIARDLLAVVDGLDHAPALQRAAAALVQRIASRPRQRLADGRAYVELSIGFVARAATTSYGTSWTAWHAVLGVVGWSSLHAREVERLGGALRVLSRGRRWGQHLALEEEALRAVEEVSREVVARGLVDDHVAFEPPPGSVRPIEIGRGRAARCPWHDDRRPSMILNLDESGSGLAVCMACASADGRRLSAHVSRLPSGEWVARLSASTLRWWTGEEVDLDLDERLPEPVVALASGPWPGADLAAPPPDAVEEQVVTGGRALPGALPGGSGEVVLGRLDGAALRGSTARGDLLAVLRRAETRSRSDRGESEAWTSAARLERAGPETDGRGYLPDRLVSVQRMMVASRRTILRRGAEVSIPDRWRPVAQEWVLLDLDRLARSLASRTREQVEEVVHEIREIARGDEWLRGDYALVETSGSGVQVWMRLRSAVDPIALSSSRFARAWLRGLARRVSDRLRSIGCGDALVDESAWGTHRFGRRPGWRLLRDGTPFRARLVSSEAA